MVSINKIARTGVLGALLMGSVALKATNPITNVNKTPNQNQTEIVSKEGAEALRAASLQGIQQSSVPTVHNSKLDNMLKKFIETDDDRKAINDLTGKIYNIQGTFLGSALMQHEIDRRALYHFITGNTKLFKNNRINPELAKTIEGFGEKFYKTITPKQETVLDWIFKKYTPALMGNLTNGQKASAKQVIDKLDDFATKKTGFDFDERSEYFIYSNGYKDKVLKNRTDNQAMADLAAYKMYLIDKLMLEKELKGADILYGTGSFPKLVNYYRNWMESVNPRTH